jgi:flagellar hook capping protein FlgD
MSRTALVTGTIVTAAMLWAVGLLASSGGVTGKSQSAQGCNCHSTSPSASGAVTVTITGPPAVKPGTINSYTLTVSGGPAGTTGGFDLSSSGGTFTAGTGSRTANGELVHSNNSHRSWTFSWTAPAAEGTVNWYAVGQATNGSGTDGDSWNWLGNAAGTAFPIVVSSSLGVDGAPGAAWLAPASPNPFRVTTAAVFSLAQRGRVRIEVLDPSGRRIATLLDGERAAGRQRVTWDGRDASGRHVGSGLYLVRMENAGRAQVQRITLMR